MTDDELREKAERWVESVEMVNDLLGDAGVGPLEDGAAFARRLLELLPPADDNEPVTAEWLKAVGAACEESKDGYRWCYVFTPATVQCFDPEGTAGTAQLEFGFREDGVLYDAVIATYLGEHAEGPDINIPKPVTRGAVRRLCSALGVELKEAK